ncbi:hypothetical protein ACFQ3W_24955 [Paenibacillus puldeungensis]|uniref:Uncharacterized protein n=1 Tax=Paenibacillus puldeungensis TaxID=696536 RepID=A0ABW3S6E4_9BACL
MEYSNGFIESFRLIASTTAEFQKFIQQSVFPLTNFSAEYQAQMQEIAKSISAYSKAINVQWSTEITPIIEQLIKENRLNTEFSVPPDIAQSISNLPQKVEKIVPVKEGESNLSNSITAIENKFTWRDALTVISVLLALLAFLNDLSSKEDKSNVDEVRQEVLKTTDQTVNYFITNYYINFPDDQPSFSKDQPFDEDHDSDR